jgi:hypothetical protein
MNKKKEGACVNCGYSSDYRCLQFAHISREEKARTKNSNKPICMGSMMQIGALEKEWKLVKLLCIRCHRLETKIENDKLVEDRKDELHPNTRRIQLHKSKLRDRQNGEKMIRLACVSCKILVTTDTLCCFDFDHRNPLEKNDKISNLISCGVPMEELETEMKKCDLMCCM